MLTVLLLSLSLAAPGDAVYIERAPTEPIVLSTPQKLELASAVAAGFPDIPPASFDDYYCFANPPSVPDRKAIDLAALAASLLWLCRVSDTNPAMDDGDALELELAEGGLCAMRDTVEASTLLCERPVMNDDGRILNDAFTESVFSKTLNLIWDFRCQRNPGDATEILCIANKVKIASPAVWRADRRAGQVSSTLGRVVQ